MCVNATNNHDSRLGMSLSETKIVYQGVYMGPKFYACVAMSHDKKCLCRMIRISKLCPSYVKSGVLPCRP